VMMDVLLEMINRAIALWDWRINFNGYAAHQVV
jgi:hypothetical protein